MANNLKMDKVFSTLALHRAGWSYRQIAREQGIHRETVGRHLRLCRAGAVIGLLVSTLSRSERAAIAFPPLVLLPQALVSRVGCGDGGTF